MKTLLRLRALLLLCGALTSGQAAGAGLADAEYYIDTDPGPGNGTAISQFSPGYEARLAVDVPAHRIAALSIGLHFMTVRFRNADGNWSVAYTRIFERIATPSVDDGRISAAEYYIDTDPGPGNGTPIDGIVPGTGADVAVQVPAGAAAALPQGMHFIAVRFRNAAGSWSVAYTRFFEKNDRLAEPAPLLSGVELRWFLEGQAVGQPAVFNAAPPDTRILVQSVAPVTGLTEGRTYRLVATPLDVNGNRGESASATVAVNITDNDGDGIADAWEVANGLNPTLASDATLDSDDDGLSNIEEFTRGTHPRRRDTSGDGIDDGLAIALGLNPLQSQPSIAATLNRLAEGQVRSLIPGRPVLIRDERTGNFRLRLGLQETGDLQTWQRLPLADGSASLEGGDLILSFQGTEPNRYYRIETGE